MENKKEKLVSDLNNGNIMSCARNNKKIMSMLDWLILTETNKYLQSKYKDLYDDLSIRTNEIQKIIISQE